MQKTKAEGNNWGWGGVYSRTSGSARLGLSNSSGSVMGCFGLFFLFVVVEILLFTTALLCQRISVFTFVDD